MSKTALVTGITGQDGAYLAEHLLERGYRVVGAERRTSTKHRARLRELGVLEDVELVDLDLADLASMIRTIDSVAPVELYNLAAQSFVGLSFHEPLHTMDVTAVGCARMLEAVRIVDPTIRFYQASSSEMFGKVQAVPQSEDTPFYPRSPYAVAKVAAHWMTVNYRESYDLFAASGILFNHESPLRGEEFVTRKISLAVARIHAGLQDRLVLGNLDAKRDWGFAPEYVDAMHRMLQLDAPEDFVIATGETHSVREFVDLAFQSVDLNWEEYVEVSERFYRPTEVDLLIGDPSKAKERLGWEPKVRFPELVERMVRADVERVSGSSVVA